MSRRDALGAIEFFGRSCRPSCRKGSGNGCEAVRLVLSSSPLPSPLLIAEGFRLQTSRPQTGRARQSRGLVDRRAKMLKPPARSVVRGAEPDRCRRTSSFLPCSNHRLPRYPAFEPVKRILSIGLGLTNGAGHAIELAARARGAPGGPTHALEGTPVGVCLCRRPLGRQRPPTGRPDISLRCSETSRTRSRSPASACPKSLPVVG
jgi:hypothetical protein